MNGLTDGRSEMTSRERTDFSMHLMTALRLTLPSYLLGSSRIWELRDNGFWFGHHRSTSVGGSPFMILQWHGYGKQASASSSLYADVRNENFQPSPRLDQTPGDRRSRNRNYTSHCSCSSACFCSRDDIVRPAPCPREGIIAPMCEQ